MPSIKVLPNVGNTVFDILGSTNRQDRVHLVKLSAYLPATCPTGQQPR